MKKMTAANVGALISFSVVVLIVFLIGLFMRIGINEERDEEPDIPQPGVTEVVVTRTSE